MAPNPLLRVRTLCLSLPDATEKLAWGTSTFRVRDKLFAMFAEGGNHHGDGRGSVWIKSTPTNQELLIEAAPKKFFKPAYVGPSGWVGVYLDKKPDWDEVLDLLTDGYRMVATKKQIAALDGAASPQSRKRAR